MLTSVAITQLLLSSSRHHCQHILLICACKAVPKATYLATHMHLFQHLMILFLSLVHLGIYVRFSNQESSAPCRHLFTFSSGHSAPQPSCSRGRPYRLREPSQRGAPHLRLLGLLGLLPPAPEALPLRSPHGHPRHKGADLPFRRRRSRLPLPN